MWMASHIEQPNFSAYAKTKGTSLALGTQTWHIFNDSKGRCLGLIFKILLCFFFLISFKKNGLHLFNFSYVLKIIHTLPPYHFLSAQMKSLHVIMATVS